MGESDRLRWRCRRGMRELDVLLNRHLEERYPTASEAEQAAFRRLLEAPDPELFGLLLGRNEATDEAESEVVRQMRAGS